MEIAEFLLARFADDEAAARRVRMDDGWELGMVTGPDDDHDPFLTISPARVLAECEAKRDLLAMADPYDFADDGGTGMSEHADKIRGLLALPYAEHPSYDESWRP